MIKTKKNIIKILSVIFLVLIGNLAIISAVIGPNVVLSNQNPDPVEPGNFVYLNVKVSNSGDTNMGDTRLTLIENDNFQISKGEDNVKELGIIPAFSSTQSSSSFAIAKYKIFVDEETPTGLNTLSFNLESNGNQFTYDFEVMVQDDNPQIELLSVNIPTIEPGKSAKFGIELKNPNSIDLKNVKIALSLGETEANTITMNSGSNEKIISFIESKGTAQTEFDILVSPEANALPYLLPIKISFEDSLGNSFNNTLFTTVKVYSPPSLSLNIDSQEVYTQGSGRVNLAIANPGSSSVKGVQLEILPSDDYTVIEGERQYIGDLNSDDFQTLQTQIYINNAQEATLKIKLIYFDSYDVKSEEIIELPLKIYNNEQLTQFGFINGGGSFNFTAIIYLIVGIVIGYIFFNIRNKRKKQNR